MFDESGKYKNNDHFFLTAKVKLEDVCNAPKGASGVYIVHELKNGRIELVYIDYSPIVQASGKIMHSNGGLYDRIVNGHQFGNIPRKKSWKQKLIDEEIDALDIYWYDTMNENTQDIPAFVGAKIMQKFFEFNGRLPRWNSEF
ncbi:MAG: hypothetical protein PHE33_03415 [Bacteroidales bacterium]|nr:hypothetical protein [Bacteroidales bacterium]